MSKKTNRNARSIKNIKKIIIFLLLITIMLIACVLIIYNNPVDRNLRYIYSSKGIEKISIMPTNVDKLSYIENVEINSIYKSMDLFVNEYVEKYYLATKDLSKEQINSYFNKNKNVIEKELGITSEEIFNEFAENLKNNLKGENLELVSYTVNPKTVKKISSKINYVIIVEYSNNQKIGFKLTIQNNIDKNKTPIFYQACTDEESLSYEYTPNDYETPDDVEPIGRVL